MSVFQTARGGLGIRATGGERVGDGDLNQMIDARLAAARVLGDILGGEGVYAGGAALLADITTGTQYPAVTLVIADDSGYLWPFKTTSATAITFNVTSTAAGDARLYAVPTMLSGVTPAAADGRYNQVRFVADDVANAAPEHSLLLGTGTIAAGALTDYTVVSTAPGTSAIAPKAHAASHADGAVDALTPASIKAVKGPGTVTDGRLMAFDGPTGYLAKQTGVVEADLALLATAQSFTARKTFSNGLLAMVRDAKYGCPVSGTYVAGDWWVDRAGALWQCVASGAPGTWEQVTAGYCGTWTGGSGTADITYTGNWQSGALLVGYRVYDTTTGEQQVYTYDGTNWLGAEVSMPMCPGQSWAAGGYSASATYTYIFFLPPGHDMIVSNWAIRVGGGASDAANTWTFSPLRFGGTSMGTAAVKNDAPTYRFNIASAATVLSSANDFLYLTVTKTGAPAAITSLFCTITYRYVRR